MPYVDRDTLGQLSAIYIPQQYEGQEYLKEDDPQIAAYYEARVAIDLVEAAKPTLEQRVAALEAIVAKLP
jgi:hypothetical protein